MKIHINNFLEIKSFYNDFEVFSFDVFDTLLFRDVEGYAYREFQICELMAKKLRDFNVNIDAYQLQFLRNVAFDKSKKITGDEVDYMQHFNIIFDFLNLKEAVRDELSQAMLDIELSYELRHTYPNPEAKGILSFLKEHGKKVLGICDMYLPKAAVIAILEKAGLYSYFDDFYVSSEGEFFSKYSGKLFRYLQENTTINFSRGIHIGDNEHSDCLMPMANSISACFYENTENIKRKERLQLEVPPRWDKNKILKTNEGKIYDILPQAFSYFVEQCFDCASRYGSKKIFLLTRDSDFLEKSFQTYLELYGLHIDVEVLHIDRLNSIFLILDDAEGLKEHLYVFNNDDESLTFSSFISKINPTPEFLESYHDKIDAYSEMNLKILLESGLIEGLVNELLREKKSQIVNYLDEHLFTEEDVILVDIGYSGTVAKNISFYLNKEKRKTGRVDCLLFASNKYIKNNAILSMDPVYIHDALVLPYDKSLAMVFDTFSWLEPFVLNKKLGPLKGYLNNIPQRVYDENEETLYEKYGVDKQVNEILLGRIRKDFNVYSLIKVGTFPSDENMKIFHDIEHCKNYDNSKSEKIIKKISLSHFMRDYKEIIESDAWLGGSFKESNLGFLSKFLFKVGKTELKKIKKKVTR